MAEKRIRRAMEPGVRRRLVVGLAAVALLALLAGVAGAQSSDKYGMWWYSLDSGSGQLASTSYGLTGTLGDSLPGLLVSDHYGLAGGYDAGFGRYHIYLPVVLRAHH